MSLTIEFIDETVTEKEINAYIRERKIPFNPKSHRLQTMPNGHVSIFIGFAGVPRLAAKSPKLPSELEVQYIFQSDVDDASLREGVYAHGEDIEVMTVQRVFDKRLGKLKSVVEIVGTDLVKIEQAFMHLRSGKLKPTQDWTSAGTVEAPAPTPAPSNGPSNGAKEGSGTHGLPPVAATETKAA